MIIGISGKKQSGKNTVADIWQYLYDYHNNDYKHPINRNDLNSYLKNSHNLKCEWEQKSFAEKIKKIVCLLLNCTMTDLEDPIFKETELGEEWWKYEVSKYYLGKKEIIKYYDYHYMENSLNAKEITKLQGYYLNLIKLTPRILMQLLGTDAGRNIIHPNIWVNSLMRDYNGSKWLISDVRFPNELEAIKMHNNKLIRVVRTFEHEDDHLSEIALDYYDDWNYVINNNGSIDNLIFKVKEIMIKEKII